ncbi:aspartate kinase [Candidatus Cetobacterium colombiensis]|uniref:Aspartokinase n=1 Tax=Candidatus Cetobacterium colombiensis TaxID=3073100 RepID=A0ABU4W9R6_9FUSO|nr:aspartate kinase [Candidatus Cetobacterium colombiensis]MDX8335331.1 aspartate kinase [Candidatus Cetobacterium colombiensis]
MRVVKKFGGSSVATTEKIKNIAKDIAKNYKHGDEVVIVVSAMGKTTDELIKLAKEISKTPDVRELDSLLSIGEQQSISLLSMALKEEGCKAISLTGAQAGIKTGGVHTKNKIESIKADRIENHLQNGEIVIVAGFQGVNENGDITTLGRGGSDTSAVALAAALKCECEIYTDVTGIYGVDPRVYVNAKKLDKISYEEMMEMANLGAGVMETRAVEIGKKYGVRIYVGQTLGVETGTYICDNSEIIEKKAVTGISINKNVIMVNLENFSAIPKNVATIFNNLAEHSINVDMISQNEVENVKGSIGFTCPLTDEHFLNNSLKDIKKHIPEIELTKRTGVIKISLVGIGMISNFGVAAKVFEVLSDIDAQFYQCTTSEISISLIIKESDAVKVVERLAQVFSI